MNSCGIDAIGGLVNDTGAGDPDGVGLGYTNGGLEVGRFRGLGLELSEEQLTHYRV